MWISPSLIHRRRRRAASFTPASVTSGTKLAWYKNGAGLYQDSAGTTPAVASNDPVGYWTNQWAAKPAIQATTASKPTLQLGAVNGKSVVRFDGVDDVLKYAGAIGLSGSAAFSFYLAFKTSALPALDSRPWQHGATAGTGGACRGLTVVNGTGWKWSFNSGNRVFTAQPAANTAYVVSSVVPAGASINAHPLSVGGTVLTQASASGGATVPDIADEVLTLGAGINASGSTLTLACDILEFALFSGDLSAEDDANMVAYMKTLAGLA